MRDQFTHHPEDLAIDGLRARMAKRRAERIAAGEGEIVEAEEIAADAKVKLDAARARLRMDRRIGDANWIAQSEARVTEAEAEYEAASLKVVELRYALNTKAAAA